MRWSDHEMEREIGQEVTLTINQELEIGRVFRTRGNAQGQSEIYWEVLKKDDNKYLCKVVGVNIYCKAIG